MKKTTLSVLLALVMVLSISVGSVFAQNSIWDEETVLTVFGDLQSNYPDLFIDVESNDLLNQQTFKLPDQTQFFDGQASSSFGQEDLSPVGKGIPADESEYASKALIDAASVTVSGEYYPCGDGRIELDIIVSRDNTIKTGYSFNTYVRSLTVDVGAAAPGAPSYLGLPIRDCRATGGDSCRMLMFNSAGQARIRGYVQVPDVLTGAALPLTVNINNVSYLTPFMTAVDLTTSGSPVPGTLPDQYNITGAGNATAKTTSYCQAGLGVTTSYMAPRAAYDANTGEARVQLALEQSAGYPFYVVPGELIVADDAAFTTNVQTYSKYVCKYSVSSHYGQPSTEYCTPGEPIRVGPASILRFDLTVEHLRPVPTGSTMYAKMRVGGIPTLAPAAGIQMNPIFRKGAKYTKISAMDPIKPMLSYIFNQEEDDAIKASGAYSVYAGGVAGYYQKCGRMAYIMTRVRNDSYDDEEINLDNIAVAVNGGTPMSFRWIFATKAAGMKNSIWLAPGEDVVLIGRAKVTDIPSQMNSDASITAAVNFLDYGLYMTGDLFSDHNNTNCVAPVVP